MKLVDGFFDFIDSATEKVSHFFIFLGKSVKFLYKKTLHVPLSKISGAWNGFAEKYLGKNQLGNKVFIKYIIKELLLYFFVAFLFFFMIFFCNQILLLAESILKKLSLVTALTLFLV